MGFRISIIYICFLLLQACGFNYQEPLAVVGGATGSMGLEIAGNPTSIELNEGSSLVVVPTLTTISTVDTEIRLTLSSVRGDVGAFFSDSFPIVATIPAGSSSTTLTLNSVHDVSYTGDLAFTVSVTSPQLSGALSLTLNLKDLEPLTLGNFSISGVGDAAESSDTTMDNALVDSTTPRVVWSSSSFATSYDVSILEDDGTTVKCPVQNTTNPEYNFSSATCVLNVGLFYRVKVTSRNGSTTLDGPLYRFQVQSTSVLASDSIMVRYDGAAVTFDPRTNDTDPSATITAVGSPSYGSTSFTGTSVTYTPDGSAVGLQTFTYTTTDGSGNVLTGTVTVRSMTYYTWTGNVSNDFSVGGNWCGNITNPGPVGTCDGASSAPSNTSQAVVDLTCSSGRCDPVISSNTILRGFILNGNSVTKTGTATFTVGDWGYKQGGGTFHSGQGDFIMDDGRFTISGGSFTAPAGKLIFHRKNVSIAPAATFNHNNGTVNIETTWSAAIDIDPGNAVFNNVYMNQNDDSFRATITGTMNIDGNLTMNQTSGYRSLENGLIKLKGDLISLNNGLAGNTIIEMIGNPLGQTFSGTAGSSVPGLKLSAGTNPVTFSGSVAVAAGSLEVVSVGTFISSGSTLKFHEMGCGYKEITPGNIHYNNIEFSIGCQFYDFKNSTWKIDGDVIFTNTDYESGMTNGTLEVMGDIITTGSLKYREGDATIKLVGNPSGQTIVGDTNSQLPGIVIDTGSNNVTMTGLINIRDKFLIESVGTFTPSANVIFDAGCAGYGSDGFQVKAIGQSFPALILSGGCPVFDFQGNALIAGDVVFDGDNLGELNNGSLLISGDVEMKSDDGYKGNAVISLSGNVLGQTISATGTNSFLPNLSINSGAEAVTLSGPNSIGVVNNYSYLGSGAFTQNTLLKIGRSDCNGDSDLAFGTAVYGNVTIDTYCKNSFLTTSAHIGGNLTFTGGAGSGDVSMPNPGAGFSLTVDGVFTKNGVTLNDYGASVPP